MVKFKESKSVKKWLASAKHDLDLAVLINCDGGYTDTVCYFCHQTIEKSLKTVLIANDIWDFPKVHKLKILLKRVFVFVPEIKDFTSSIVQMDKYFIETKYPPDIPIIYSHDEAEQALSMATKIYEFTEKIIQKQSSAPAQT